MFDANGLQGNVGDVDGTLTEPSVPNNGIAAGASEDEADAGGTDYVAPSTGQAEMYDKGWVPGSSTPQDYVAPSTGQAEKYDKGLVPGSSTPQAEIANTPGGTQVYATYAESRAAVVTSAKQDNTPGGTQVYATYAESRAAVVTSAKQDNTAGGTQVYATYAESSALKTRSSASATKQATEQEIDDDNHEYTNKNAIEIQLAGLPAGSRSALTTGSVYSEFGTSNSNVRRSTMDQFAARPKGGASGKASASARKVRAQTMDSKAMPRPKSKVT
eukprot:gene26331-13963_t